MEEKGVIAIPSQVPVALIEIDAQALLDSFLSGKSERTIQAYRRDLDDFRKFLGATSMNEAARKFLAGSLGEANYVALQYRKHLVERPLQPTTVNRKLAALRSLSDMAYTLGMVNWRVRVKNQKVFEGSRVYVVRRNGNFEGRN